MSLCQKQLRLSSEVDECKPLLVGEGTGVAALAGVTEGHDLIPDVLTSVVHWLRRGGDDEIVKLNERLNDFRITTLEGGAHCRNETCEVVGLLHEFKVCPQCKTTRYCGDACQKQDWNAGGHKKKCGTSAACSSCSL